MHILLIHQAFAAIDQPGGTRHHELARYLCARGHQMTIITSPVSYLTGKHANRDTPLHRQPVAEPGIQILRAYTYPALHRSFVHRVFSFLSFMISSFFLGLRVPRVDLVWGTSPPIFQGVTAWLLARLKRVPFLFEVRDLWPAFAVAVGVLKQPILIRLSEWLERFLYRRTDYLIVNSPGFIDHVRHKGAGKVALIPNGADVSMFDPEMDPTGTRARYELTDKFVVLYAGAHGLSNDLDVVLDAAALIPEQVQVAFVLLGDGKEKPRLRQRATVLGLHNVVFLDPVPKLEIPALLAAADACLGILKPVSLYNTVFPNKIFDYLAAGRPIILAMEGVIRQVIEDAKAGVCIPPGNPHALAQAVLNLAQNPVACRQMGERGRSFVAAHYDRAIIGEQLNQLLFELKQTQQRN